MDMYSSCPGKTLAFVLPLVAALGSPGTGADGIRSVIVAPTVELVAQLARELRRVLAASGRRWRVWEVAKGSAREGGAKQATQRADVLLAPPRRLAGLIAAKAVDLSSVRHVVLDEADRLLDLGFVAQVDTIVGAVRALRRPAGGVGRD